MAPSERLNGETLNLRFDDTPELFRIPLSEELAALEDAVVEGLEGVIPPGAESRMLLLGPGPSKTDPVYALRFLARLAAKTDTAGQLTAYDLQNQSDIVRYYAQLPWGPNHAHYEWGRGGNYERLKGAGAHLILSIHPGVHFEVLFGSFANNLVRGGIGVMQGSVPQEVAEEDLYEHFLDMVMAPFKDTLDFFRPPLRSRLFRSFFSERSNDVHVLTVRRR